MLPPLVKTVGVAGAAKVFVLAILFLTTSGALFLNYALFRRLSWLPFASFLLAYNWIVTWGFANYLFGLGLWLWILGAWFRSEHWSWPIRIACFSVLGYVLVICHAYTFGFYGAAVVSAEFAIRWHRRHDLRMWREQRLWLALAQFILRAALFILTSPSAGSLAFGAVFRFQTKAHALGTLVNTGTFWPDLTICMALYAAFAVAVWRRWLRVDARIGWLLVAVVGLFPLWPDYILSAAFAAYRLPVAFALLAIAASAPERVEDGRRHYIWIAIIGVLLSVQIGFVATQWMRFDREYAAIANIVGDVPTGNKLLVAIPEDDRYHNPNEPPVAYAALLEGTDRHIFVNGAFVWPQDNSSIHLTAPYRWLQDDPAWMPDYYPKQVAAIRRAPFTADESPFRPKILAAYDYLLVKDESRFGVSLSSTYPMVAATGPYRLYKLH